MPALRVRTPEALLHDGLPPICRTKSGKMQRSMTMSENVYLILELAQSNLSNVCFISLRETPLVLIVCHRRVQTVEREDIVFSALNQRIRLTGGSRRASGCGWSDDVP